MATVTEHYSELFKSEFKNAVDHYYLKVTPFTFPKVDPNRELVFVSANTPHVMSVQDHGDFLNFKTGTMPSNVAILPYVEHKIEQLAQRAAGAYSAYCLLAREKHGGGCGVAHNMKFGVVFSSQPSIADPNAQFPGWVGFRFQFVACPQEWLAYVFQVE